MIISTQNFHPERDVKLKCTCGNYKCDKRSVLQQHLNRIQRVRDILGIPLTITSGGRCPYHPDERHRTTPADHQKCQACDIKVNGATRGNVVSAGLAAGCNAIGVAKTFVHLGFRNTKKGHITMWVY